MTNNRNLGELYLKPETIHRPKPRILIDQIRASKEILYNSQLRSFPYKVSICETEFDVNKDVFSPEFFKSTELFSSWLSEFNLGRFLEIGCGIGATTSIVAKNGAATQATAVDISSAAVANTKNNFHRLGLDNKCEVIQSDVFDNINPAEKYDTIYWNAPFIYVHEDFEIESTLDLALFDRDYNCTYRFIKECRNFLSDKGRVFIGFGNFGDLPNLVWLAHSVGYGILVVNSAHSEEGGAVTFDLLELIPLDE